MARRNASQVLLATLLEEAIADCEARGVPAGEFRYAEVASRIFELPDVLEVLVGATGMHPETQARWMHRLASDEPLEFDGLNPDEVAA